MKYVVQRITTEEQEIDSELGPDDALEGALDYSNQYHWSTNTSYLVKEVTA